MRIAIVTPLFPIPGDPTRGKPILNTVRELATRADVRVFCPNAVYPRWRLLQPRSYVYHKAEAGVSTEGIESEYFDYRTLPLLGRPFNAHSCFRALLPRLRAWNPEIVLAYWLHPEGRAAWMAARALRVPAVVGSRGSDLRRPADAWSAWATRDTVLKADAVLTVSDELRGQALRMGADPSLVHTIRNGCDRAVFRPQWREEARRRLGLSPAAPLVLYVGHLAEHKGVLDLASAFQLLHRQSPECEVAFIGEGRCAEEIRSQLRSAGIESRLHMPGPLPAEEIARWMSASDVFCLPSHTEGCPNVVIEALACGRPVVGTRVGGTPELIDEQSGLLVEPHQPAELARSLLATLGRAWSSEVLSSGRGRGWDDVARETIEVCAAMLSRCRKT
jgi:teichuronic acid biosynthesis glycosyltransferase TuaC